MSRDSTAARKVRLVTVIGVGNYRKVVYDFGDSRNGDQPDSSTGTRLFPLALLKNLTDRGVKIQDVLICCTPEAEQSGRTEDQPQTYTEELTDYCNTLDIPMSIVSIKSPQNEEDLWSTFSEISGRINSGDEVIFDITHGYRPLFLVLFLSAHFISIIRDAKVAGLYYGAYDARSSSTDIAPVWDLSELLTLLNWSSATQTFLETGHAKKLKDLLCGIQNEAWQGDPSDGPKTLKTLASSLSRLSQALLLARPEESVKAAGELMSNLAKANREVADYALPFSHLAPLIEKDLEVFTGTLSAEEPTNSIGFLKQHGALVIRAVERDDGLQAVILAREWIISYACHRCGYAPDDWHARTKVEKALSRPVDGKRRLDTTPCPHPEVENTLNRAKEGQYDHLNKLCCNIGGLRNDLAHAGMRKNAGTSDGLVKGIRKLSESLGELLRELG